MRLASLAFTAILLLVSACGGSSGGGGGTNPSGTSPIVGASLKTLETNLGVVVNTPRTITGASTYRGAQDGTLTVESDGGNPRMSATIGDITTPVLLTGRGQTSPGMDGRMLRTTQQGTVFYVPSDRSPLHMGMVRQSTQDQSVYGVFGRTSGADDVAGKVRAGAVGTYTGVAEIGIDDPVRRVVDGYAGAMTATVDFAKADIDFSAKSMANTTQTGTGNASMTGSGTFFADGSIRGGFTATHPTGPQLGGSVNGAFYGPQANGMGLVFVGPDMAGAAILGAQ